MSNFSESKINTSNFMEADCKYSIFNYAYLYNNNFYKSNLFRSSMHDTKVDKSIFIRANKKFIQKDDKELLEAERWDRYN